MRAGFNPVRRNRNIGTAKAGHGRDNRLVVPSRWSSPARHFEVLGEYEVATRLISGSIISFIVEQTRSHFHHACTIDDIATILGHIPREDMRDLKTFVLRQPKRKEDILQSAWGRLAFEADLGRPQDGGGFHGPMVFLHAMDPSGGYWRKTSLGPISGKELERVREDGHTVARIKGRFRVDYNVEAIRNTQLYRTIPHEIGHWVDYLEKVVRPADGSAGAYWSRPDWEREVAAHRYADATRQRLTAAGIIPFPRKLLPDSG